MDPRVGNFLRTVAALITIARAGLTLWGLATSGVLLIVILLVLEEVSTRWRQLSTGTQVCAYIATTLVVAAFAQGAYRAFRRWRHPAPELIEALTKAFGQLRMMRVGVDQSLWEDDELAIASEWLECWRFGLLDLLEAHGQSHKFAFVDTVPQRRATIRLGDGRKFSNYKMNVLHHIDTRLARLAEYMGQL